MHASADIRAVVFDLGGVLVDWDPRYLYRRLFDSEEEMEYFLTHVCSPEWNIRQDAGRPLEEATRMLVDRHPEYEEAIRAFYGRWSEMLAGDIPGTVRLLEDLASRGTHRLLALTNWSHETFHFAEERFGWLAHFEGVIVSGREKRIKPEPELFELLISRYRLRPEQSLFIDDNAANVTAAQHLGFQAVRFHSPGQLQIELEARRVVLASH